MCALAGADQGERRFVSIYRKATQTGGVRDEEDEEIVTSEDTPKQKGHGSFEP